ncbi:hypothetical protein NC651_036069 [Populus alba x Populus x berolinensis]|nr:hypothetical protein NC651_036069 [Populus alba x Populus x berolinensis]
MNKITKLPVWIQIYDLPFPLWTKEGLSEVASMVGQPLSCDELTLGCKRLDYARLCVEVDASLPFVHKFELEFSNTIREVHVNYEWKPKRCEKCHVFGHSCQLSADKQVNSDAFTSHQVKGNASPATNTDDKQLNSDASTSHQGKGNAITSLATNTNEMSPEELDSSVETDTYYSDETDTDESASDSSDESQLKPSDLGDVNPITPPLSINNHVWTSPLELPMCTTSKQMALPSSSETSSSFQVSPKDLPKMAPSRARPSKSISAAQSVASDDTGFTLVTRRKKKKDIPEMKTRAATHRLGFMVSGFRVSGFWGFRVCSHIIFWFFSAATLVPLDLFSDYPWPPLIVPLFQDHPHTKPTHLPQPSTSNKPSSNPPQISSLLPSIRTTNPLHPHSGSWAERVRVTDTSTRFSLDPIPRQECGARLRIPAELLSESADKWNSKCCLFGHVCPETGVKEPAQKNPKTIPTEALPPADAGKNNDSGNIAKGTNKSPQENTLVVDAGNITNEVHYTVAARKNKARAFDLNGPLHTQLTEQIDSRHDHLPKKPMEQLHIVPFNNKNYHVESNLDNEGEEGESDNDPTHDYQLIEENQLLITGFDRCVESKMASLKSSSEASSSADASSTFIGCWNIWGLNNPKKHRFISEWVHNSKLGIIGMLETKVAPSNLDTVIAGLNLHSWSFISNANVSPTCHILVGWDTKIVKISCLHYTDQWLTCEVTSLASKEISRFTFVYGHNTPARRCLIWEYIVQHAPLFSSSPWALMAELIQIPYSGLKFSWHNGQTRRDTIMRKLDWIFCNPAFLNTWPAAHSKFLPRDASDHSAMILDFSHHKPQGPAPFKFLNLWADIEDFLDIVQAVWQPPISGNPMYCLTAKLRLVKNACKSLHRQHTSHISRKVAEAKASWNSAQVALDESPGAIELMSAERNHARIYSQLCKEEEAFYKQRSRIQWLSLGDKNTKFFHRSLVHRQSRNRVHGLTDEAGNQVTANKEIGQVAVAYYQNLLAAPLIHHKRKS